MYNWITYLYPRNNIVNQVWVNEKLKSPIFFFSALVLYVFLWTRSNYRVWSNLSRFQCIWFGTDTANEFYRTNQIYKNLVKFIENII